MTLKQMRYTIAVARYQSFNEAAKRLYVSQPSLTSAIQSLEAEIGFLIFKRFRSGVELTDAGGEYLQRIQAIVEQVDGLEEEYQATAQKTRYFSISAQHYNFPVDVLIHMLKETDGRYRFSILETHTRQVIQNVAEGISEIGVLYFSRRSKAVILRELRIQGLSFHLLDVHGTAAYLRKEHPLTAYDRITLQQLTPYPFLSFYQGKNGSDNFTEEIADISRKKQVIYIEDKSSGWHILKHTDAYSIGSGMLEPEWTPDVITIPIVDGEPMHIGWICKKQAILSPLAERFVELADREVKRQTF